ncbi:hypothetical protein D1007_42207 [Hordeum vulgare]|nr:hypothetical protein D1007_42207 [Hordeum vulgare]
MTGRYQPPRSNQQLPPSAGPGNGPGALRGRQGSAKKRRGQGTLPGLVPRRRLYRGPGSSGYWSVDPVVDRFQCFHAAPPPPPPPPSPDMTGLYQPPRSNQQLPPSAGPGNGPGALRGRQGSAKKRRGQDTLPGLVPRRRLCRGPGSSGYWSADPVVDRFQCFNCGIVGHAQISWTNPTCCYVCKYPGHPAFLCPDCLVTDEVMMYGHGIEGLGFLPNEWDWHVTRTADNEFTVVFRDATSHGYATRSADMTLALNKLMVDISEPIRDPKVVAVLNTAWILISGLPNIARPDRVIRKM